MNSELDDREIRRGPGRTKVLIVPELGEITFAMRYRDRRGGGGFALIEPREGVQGGFALMKGYGKRRSVVVQWHDNNGIAHYWIDGPWIGCRGRASGRYGTNRGKSSR